MPTITTLDLLAEQPFLAGLSKDWLERLSFQAHPVVRAAGRRLFQEDRPARHFWLLRSGRVALDIHLPDHGEVVVETLGPGSVLGWSWLFPPYRWHFGAITVEQTLAVEFDGPGVRRLIADDAELGRELTTRFMAVVVDRLQATRVRLLEGYGYPAGD
jgi:CRP/FNR family cyclic AMP-dependent transcriptional regulator